MASSTIQTPAAIDKVEVRLGSEITLQGMVDNYESGLVACTVDEAAEFLAKRVCIGYRVMKGVEPVINGTWYSRAGTEPLRTNPLKIEVRESSVLIPKPPSNRYVHIARLTQEFKGGVHHFNPGFTATVLPPTEECPIINGRLDVETQSWKTRMSFILRNEHGLEPAGLSDVITTAFDRGKEFLEAAVSGDLDPIYGYDQSKPGMGFPQDLV